MTSLDIHNATFSPESADGVSRSRSLAGLSPCPSGRAHVPVSRFRSRDTGKPMPTNDTCGPLFTRSSKSASHQTSLESRLRTAMDTNGSPEFVLTWKEVDMRSGPPICALRASARRKSGSGFIGVPTPRASMGEHMVCWARAESGEHRSQIEDFLASLGMAAGHLTRLGGANVCPLLCAAIMGFPPSFVDSAMRSFRSLRQNSSEHPSATEPANIGSQQRAQSAEANP